MSGGAHPSLREPPEEGCEAFPSRAVEPGDPLFRFFRRNHGPWWFCSCGKHRFDLADPSGTCYLGGDELTAVLEVIGPDVRDQLVSRAFMDDRQLRKLSLPRAFAVADTLDRRASGFGVTREIGTITPYDLPQRWGRCFATARHDGVRYGPRHDVLPEAWAIGLFGRAGERKTWRRGEVSPTDRVEQLLAEECGIRIQPIPTSTDVTVVEEE